MKKKGKGGLTVKRTFRVECNRGSKYFDDEARAKAYADYASLAGYESELWSELRCYDESGTLVMAKQKLLEVVNAEKVLVLIH